MPTPTSYAPTGGKSGSYKPAAYKPADPNDPDYAAARERADRLNTARQEQHDGRIARKETAAFRAGETGQANPGFNTASSCTQLKANIQARMDAGAAPDPIQVRLASHCPAGP